MYYTQDIFEAQYAVKELSREVQTPRESSWGRLKRVLRFLQGRKQRGLWFPAAGDITECKAWSDTNWANCKATRKSTSAGVIQFGGCTVCAYSRTQSIVAGAGGIAEW